MSSCPAFWLNQPRILWDQAAEFFPFTERDQRCTAAALNSFTRFGLYLGFVMAIVRMEPGWLLTGLVFAAFSVGAWLWMSGKGAIREGFASGLLQMLTQGQQDEGFTDTKAPVVDAAAVSGNYVPDVIGQRGRTEPTAANPFMNVLISEISMDPKRSPAENGQREAIRSELDSYFETMFASDPGDAFQHTQSQRQWVTMPSTTIPNDQESFQNWLYRVPGQTCKEGNVAVCNFDTGDAALPWREMRRLT